MLKLIVLSLGGSLIVPNGGPDYRFLKKFRKVILRWVEKRGRFLIVCGGGKICRIYQESAQKITSLEKEDIDWLGIHATHLNGHLLRTIFREHAHPKVLTHYNEKEDIPEPIVIAAGWRPGRSTDYDAIAFAKLYDTNTVINLSNISYVYDKDPNKFPDPKPLKKISWEDFLKLVGDTWHPGANTPFDPVASKLAQKAGIKVVVMDGRDLRNFENYLEGKEFEGTVIS